MKCQFPPEIMTDRPIDQPTDGGVMVYGKFKNLTVLCFGAVVGREEECGGLPLTGGGRPAQEGVQVYRRCTDVPLAGDG